MTDTNQLPPLPTLRPGDSRSERLIDAAMLGHASTREAMRWLVRQLMPMQARAQVQGDSASVTYGCHCDLDPGMKPDGCVLDYGNQNDCVHARGISNREECHEWRPIHITTPQPAQATQAEVTDERLLEIGREWTKEVGWYEFEVNDFIGCARAILALRTEWVPMTPDEISDAYDEVKAHSMLSFMKGVRAAETHHFGITAQAQKGQP